MALPSEYTRPRDFTRGQKIQLRIIMILFPAIALLAIFGWVIEYQSGQTQIKFIDAVIDFQEATIFSDAISLYRDCLQDVKLHQYMGMSSEDIDSSYELCMSSLDEETKNLLENPFKDKSVLIGDNDKA